VSQIALLSAPRPRLPEGIHLLCASAEEGCALARELGGARLVVVDAPWDAYEQRPGVSAPDEQYAVLPPATIAAHTAAAVDATLPDARLAQWWCWPLEAEAHATRPGSPFRYVSGGSWTKLGENGRPAVGVGYHWRGASEPVALFVRGSCGRADELVCNGWASEPGAHSAKPVAWLRQWVRAWTSPGDLVLDLYAGLGSVAVACALEGRRYVGTEIDPEHHAAACGYVALRRGAA